MLITVEDTQNRAEIKIKRALEEVKQLLVPIVSVLSFQINCKVVHKFKD